MPKCNRRWSSNSSTRSSSVRVSCTSADTPDEIDTRIGAFAHRARFQWMYMVPRRVGDSLVSTMRPKQSSSAGQNWVGNNTTTLLMRPKPIRSMARVLAVGRDGTKSGGDSLSTPSGSVTMQQRAFSLRSSPSAVLATTTTPSSGVVVSTRTTSWPRRTSRPTAMASVIALYPFGISACSEPKSHSSSWSQWRSEIRSRSVAAAYSRFAQCHSSDRAPTVSPRRLVDPSVSAFHLSSCSTRLVIAGPRPMPSELGFSLSFAVASKAELNSMCVSSSVALSTNDASASSSSGTSCVRSKMCILSPSCLTSSDTGLPLVPVMMDAPRSTPKLSSKSLSGSNSDTMDRSVRVRPPVRSRASSTMTE
mmetsp:Transcript_12983/g.40974  ORF Transcript_12983/g.40974 Transcript_12983/m.40974 type:complete len:363 (-) Transcript_12983:1876-2964(-)